MLILIPDMRADIWEPISVFPRVFWQRGSQLSHADLNRANIVRSFSVVIFAAPESRRQVDEVQTNDFKVTWPASQQCTASSRHRRVPSAV